MTRSNLRMSFRSNPAARPGHTESRLACRPAFSLIELMIVLAILSLLAALVVPNLQRNFDRNHLKDAGRRLQEKMGELRQEASQSGRPVLVQFGWGSDQIRILRLPAPPLPAVGSDQWTHATGFSPATTSGDTFGDQTLGNQSLGNQSLGNQPQDAASAWQEEIWQLEDTVAFYSQAQSASESTAVGSPSTSARGSSTESSASESLGALESNDLATAFPTSSSSATAGSTNWSEPMLLTGHGVQSEQLIWLASEQWQCPLYLPTVSSELQVGRIRRIVSENGEPGFGNANSSGSSDSPTTSSGTTGRGITL